MLVSASLFLASISAPPTGSPPLLKETRPGDDQLIYVCEFGPAVMNDYLVVMPKKDPQQANLHILSFYTPGGWGKMGGITPMQRTGSEGEALTFKGEDVRFEVEGSAGKLHYFSAKVPCPLELAK